MMETEAGTDATLLRVEGLTKQFGDFTAVNDVSFGVDGDDITALIGPNGAGKTTTYNLITGKLTPTAGQVLFKGEDVTGLSVAKRTARGMARSFQINNFYDGLTVRQNLRVPIVARSEDRFEMFDDIEDKTAINDDVDELLELLNLRDVANVECETLPYGAKRRVEIGVALATEPELLMLDEPTAGMTPEETVEMVELIQRLDAETETAFFVTEHNMNVVFTLASEIIVLHRGEILATGTPEAITENEEVQAAYLGGEQSSTQAVPDRVAAETKASDRTGDLLLEIEDIDTFYGESQALHDVSLRVNEGEIVGLLGRNGAGKTTTLRSIIGIAPPRSGRIHLRGERIDGKPPHEISRLGIGYVPEERDVFTHLSVEENLNIARRSDSPWTNSRIYDLFPSLEERADSSGDQLSGGEQQMLAISRALVSDPDILLLDEPSEGLAPVIVDDLRDALQEIADTGTTILLAEQNTEFAFSLNDRNYILDNGRIQWTGTTEELIENREYIDQYLSLSDISEVTSVESDD